MTDEDKYGERIAFATSKTPGGQAQRWTELSVHYRDMADRPWTAIARGMSNLQHERTRESVITVGTLERALRLFDQGTQLGRTVALQAEDWEEQKRRAETAAAIHDASDQLRGAERSGPGGAVSRPRESGAIPILEPGEEIAVKPREPFPSQEEALRWLYGEELEAAKPQTLIARDFGAGESTVRAALAAGREIKIPLTAALRFFDKGAFDSFREAARG